MTAGPVGAAFAAARTRAAEPVGTSRVFFRGMDTDLGRHRVPVQSQFGAGERGRTKRRYRSVYVRYTWLLRISKDMIDFEETVVWAYQLCARHSI